jgi:hypothetical protein
MARPQDLRPITEGTYRERRAYLADHVFLSALAEASRPMTCSVRKSGRI